MKAHNNEAEADSLQLLKENLGALLEKAGVEACGATYERLLAILESRREKAGEKAKKKAMAAFSENLTGNRVRGAWNDIFPTAKTQKEKPEDSKNIGTEIPQLNEGA